MNPIGQRIYDLRIERDIQQGELANAVGLHQSVLNRIEKGSRPARDSEITAIASYLHVSSDYLLGLASESAQPLPPSQPPDRAVIIHMPSQPAMNPEEQNLVSLFRLLDSRGQHTVLDTLEREYSYVKAKKKEA